MGSYSHTYHRAPSDGRTGARARTRSFNTDPELPSAGVLTLYVLVLTLGVYYLLRRTHLAPPRSLPGLLWDVLVYITPPALILAFETPPEPVTTPAPAHNRHEPAPGTYAAARTFGAKSAAMRRITRLDSVHAITTKLLGAPRRFSTVGASTWTAAAAARDAGAPAGLGNWDNSCYQNSVLQGLAALPSVATYLAGEDVKEGTECKEVEEEEDEDEEGSVTWALRGMIEQLNDPANGGRRLWPPRALQRMSSWQQQDAQEYFAKVVDALDRDAARALRRRRAASDGLAELRNLSGSPKMRLWTTDGTVDASSLSPNPASTNAQRRNPLEGLLAQRVGCLRCGLVEGISLIPFNCLTLPLGHGYGGLGTTLAACLTESTRLEPILGVECAHCTLRHHEAALARLLHAPTPPPSSSRCMPPGG